MVDDANEILEGKKSVTVVKLGTNVEVLVVKGSMLRSASLWLMVEVVLAVVSMAPTEVIGLSVVFSRGEELANEVGSVMTITEVSSTVVTRVVTARVPELLYVMTVVYGLGVGVTMIVELVE